MTDAATVRDVAALARLAISDQDIENATAEFNQTLALFDALSSADTTNAAPMNSNISTYILSACVTRVSITAKPDCAKT